jgi:Protein of unknown function (DUF2795)
MDRGSDKHAGRLDENLKSDTRSVVRGAPVEARASESREQEGPGENDPTPDSRLVGGRVPADGSQPTDEELEARAEIARHLDPSVFPADPRALVRSAEGNQAPEWIRDMLSHLPEGTYPNTEAVWEALGGTAEHRF